MPQEVNADRQRRLEDVPPGTMVGKCPVDHEQSKAAAHLLENGATVESLDYHNATPLHHAAERGGTRCAHVQLDEGARPDARDRYERTPLHTAARDGRRAVAAMLIEAGSPVNARDLSKEPPLDAASGRVCKRLRRHGGTSVRQTTDGRGFRVCSTRHTGRQRCAGQANAALQFGKPDAARYRALRIAGWANLIRNR